jgi:uncharacterized protein YrrD
MLKSTNQLHGVTVLASDGDAGTVKDVFFDDERWAVRYLVVETGSWLNSRKVLVSPMAVSGAGWDAQGLRLNLTREQIRNSPHVDTDKPVSRQHEVEFSDYHGYPYYWGGPLVWGFAAYPVPTADLVPQAREAASERAAPEPQPGDPHLRSSKEVIGYELQATDDAVGHVEDFLIDDSDWSIRLMLVDTRNWWPGKKVLVSPGRIEQVSWENRQIAVNITRAEVEASPEYDPAKAGVEAASLYRAGRGPLL